MVWAQNRSFNCQACNEKLRCFLHEAGNVDSCPVCHAEFLVPGEEEWKRHGEEQHRMELGRQQLLAEAERKNKERVREGELRSNLKTTGKLEDLGLVDATIANSKNTAQISHKETVKKCSVCGQLNVFGAADKAAQMGAAGASMAGGGISLIAIGLIPFTCGLSLLLVPLGAISTAVGTKNLNDLTKCRNCGSKNLHTIDVITPN